MDLTLDQFAEGTGSTEANAAEYFEHVNPVLFRYNIKTPEQIAAFLATLGIETEHLTRMEEGLYYTHAERLMQVYPSLFHTEAQAQKCVRNPKLLSQLRYAGFHGRGGCQLTWRTNYKLHGDRLHLDLVADPDLLKQPEYAILIAGDYWDIHDCNDIAYDMGEVTRRVNGPARLKLAERIALRNSALEALA